MAAERNLQASPEHALLWQALALLTDADHRMFEAATALKLSALLPKLFALRVDEMLEVLDLDNGSDEHEVGGRVLAETRRSKANHAAETARAKRKGGKADGRQRKKRELGNLYYHPLNAKGLHLLRWMLSRRVVDRQRILNGWSNHPEYAGFMQRGLIRRRLALWSPNASIVPLTAEELDLIALASGRRSAQFQHENCRRLPAAKGRLRAQAGSAPANSRATGIFARGSHGHVFRDADDQYMLHVDVYLPNIKWMVWRERAALKRGPFHFVQGSHRITASKLRWLFERTRHLTVQSYFPTHGATRHQLPSPANLIRIRARAENATSSRATPSGEGSLLQRVHRSIDGQMEQSSRAPGGRQWCVATSDCMHQSYLDQQIDLEEAYDLGRPTPLEVDAGTLVIVDTSGFHFRGYGPAGKKRAEMGKMWVQGQGCKTGSFGILGGIVSVPRVPVIACANTTFRAAQSSVCGAMER